MLPLWLCLLLVALVLVGIARALWRMAVWVSRHDDTVSDHTRYRYMEESDGLD